MNIKVAAFTVSEKSINRTFCFLFMENINDDLEFWVYLFAGNKSHLFTAHSDYMLFGRWFGGVIMC